MLQIFPSYKGTRYCQNWYNKFPIMRSKYEITNQHLRSPYEKWYLFSLLIKSHYLNMMTDMTNMRCPTFIYLLELPSIWDFGRKKRDKGERTDERVGLFDVKRVTKRPVLRKRFETRTVIEIKCMSCPGINPSIEQFDIKIMRMWMGRRLRIWKVAWNSRANAGFTQHFDSTWHQNTILEFAPSKDTK